MKFSELWLREWVDPKISTEELCHQLTMAGLEVDDCHPVAPNFDGVVVGYVIECGPHPNADKLQVTKVDVGQSELLEIVCGARNCRKGLKVACATVGAKLPGDFVIKSAKLRGEPSEGMLCSFSELGIDSDADGIIELPESAPIGSNIRDYLKLDDHIIDISVTPNRADCFSIVGVARDISAVNNLKLADIDAKAVESVITDKKAVHLKAPKAAPKYLARIIKNIDVTQCSPLWLIEKLRRGGIRSINPIVDVTNFVLLELGHPMHGFDLAKIDGDISVRYANENESLILLDESNVKLKANTLVIADDKKVLAMAGIFGGLESGVNSETKDILLESAFFSPDVISGKAREYGLHTESSHRYERGVDSELQNIAMERATQLILDICGGNAGPVVEAMDKEALPKTNHITLRKEKLMNLIGCDIPNETISDILQKLGFTITMSNEQWEVNVPSWRFDCTIEEDLIEEVARIYGYNRIQNRTLKLGLSMLDNATQTAEINSLKLKLINKGFQEAITYSFVDPKKQAILHPNQEMLNLPNPISSEMSAMRLSLWTGLIDAISYNQNRQQTRLKLFETGLTFTPDESSNLGVKQIQVISGVIIGNVHDEHWAIPKKAYDFFDLKGDVLSLLSNIDEQIQFRFECSTHSALHPGQSATIYLGDQMIGEFGAVHPAVQKQLDINSTLFAFELGLDKLVQHKKIKAKEISKFPANRRDIAIVISDEISASDILAVIREVAGSMLIDLKVFDVYQGENIDAGFKSLAITLTLQQIDRTLEDTEISAVIDDCVKALSEKFNAKLR